MNRVIAGDYKRQGIMKVWNSVYITLPGLKMLKLSKSTIEEYEVINTTESVSSSSAMTRAAVGSFFLGPAGLAAGLGAKRNGAYWIAVQFKDGKRSLLEVDNRIFRAITISLF